MGRFRVGQEDSGNFLQDKNQKRKAEGKQLGFINNGYLGFQGVCGDALELLM